METEESDEKVVPELQEGEPSVQQKKGIIQLYIMTMTMYKQSSSWSTPDPFCEVQNKSTL